MPMPHAVVWLDHRSAVVQQFDTGQFHIRKVHTHHHDTGNGRGRRRTEREYFGEVCDELAGIAQVVITGSRTALSDFRFYVDRHRAAVALQIAGWVTAEQPTEGQSLAFARRYFTEQAQPPKTHRAAD